MASGAAARDAALPAMAPKTAAATASSDPSTSAGDRPRPPRKLNRSANQLHRNQACLPCRRRRIKCDAGKPHCSSCVRSFRFLARTQPDPDRDARGVQCQYEDQGDSGEQSDGEMRGVGEEDPRAAVTKLEARVADLQSAIARLTSPTSSSHSQHQLYSQDNMSWMMDPMQHSVGTETSPFASMKSGHGHHGSMHADGSGGNHMAGLHGITGGSHISDVHHDAAAAAAAVTGTSLLLNGMPVRDAMGATVDLSMGGMGSMPSVGVPGARSLPTMSQHQQHQQQPRPHSSSALNQKMPGSMDSLDHDGNSGSQFNELLWPDWPSRLPTLEVLDYIVQTFFTIVPSVSRIINRETLIARLGLPPQHGHFPHLALLHAICALTARYTAAVHTCPIEEVINTTNEEIQGKRRQSHQSVEEEAASQRCFGERHAMFAQLEIRWSDVAGRRMLDVAQAAVIMAVYLQQHAKWIEGWMMVGTAVRLAIPMGLMNDASKLRQPNTIVEPPENDVEREERRLLIAYVMTLDFSFSAPSGWPVSLSHDELWSRLPAAKGQFVHGTIPENPQLWWDEKLYFEHPVIDSFLLYAKACHLLGSVLKYARKIQTVKNLPEVRTGTLAICIEKEVSSFKSSFPQDMQDPFRPPAGQRGLDPDLLNAHLLVHVVAIKLHEPFADLKNMREDSTLRVINEARSVLDIPYHLFYFLIAARILVQLYKCALQAGDLTSAKVFLSEIDVFRTTFSAMAHRIALSARHLAMLDIQLSNAHTESGIDYATMRENGDPLAKGPWRSQVHIAEYSEHQWLFADQQPPTSGSGEPSPANAGNVSAPTPGEKNIINGPECPLFLTPSTFIAAQAEQQSADVATSAAIAARFDRASPNSSPRDGSSPGRTASLSGVNVMTQDTPQQRTQGQQQQQQPQLHIHTHSNHHAQHQPHPHFQYPAPSYPVEYEAPAYSNFSDTQAAWLHSVAAATIPRTYGYGEGG